MQQFFGCPGCSRHVRVAESSCPFCSTLLARPSVKRSVATGLGSTFLLGACVATQGSDGAGPDAALPGDAGPTGDASHTDASARVGDSEESFVPVYGAPACDFAPSGAETSPMLGGAVVAAAAFALLRRLRAPQG